MSVTGLGFVVSLSLLNTSMSQQHRGHETPGLPGNFCSLRDLPVLQRCLCNSPVLLDTLVHGDAVYVSCWLLKISPVICLFTGTFLFFMLSLENYYKEKEKNNCCLFFFSLITFKTSVICFHSPILNKKKKKKMYQSTRKVACWE